MIDFIDHHRIFMHFSSFFPLTEVLGDDFTSVWMLQASFLSVSHHSLLLLTLHRFSMTFMAFQPSLVASIYTSYTSDDMF